MRLMMLILCMVLSAQAVAQRQYEIDGPECDGPAVGLNLVKTGLRTDSAHRQSMYGQIEFRRTPSDVGSQRCSITYRIFLSKSQSQFEEIEHLDWQTEEGEIASLKVVGFSVDGMRLAADLMLSAGDWTEHRVFELDERSKKTAFRSIEDKIYKASEPIGGSMDNYYELLSGVSNEGLIHVTSYADGTRRPVPIADWTFNPWTGVVERKRRRRW